MLTVFVDPDVVTGEKQRELILKACEDVGAKCDFVPQRVTRTISWQPPPTAQASASDDIRKEVLAVLNAEEAVSMINAYIQHKQGIADEQMTLTEWVGSLQAELSDHNLTVIIVGLSKYFNNQKLTAKQKHREAVTGQPTKGKKKTAQTAPKITTSDAEEAFVEVQLITGCIIQQVSTDEELASQIKLYTKAVADKPNKKDRFNSVFSFLEEGTAGLNVNKQGEGLRKVWKHQLMQFKNFGPEMAEALLNSYPSPLSLHEACKSCSTSKETEQVLGDINVRRNASVISTNRKIGKEHARRIHTFMTSTDPDQVIK